MTLGCRRKEPFDYVNRHEGKIIYTDLENDGDNGTQVGTTSVIVFDLLAGDRGGFNPYTVTDSLDYDSALYGHAVLTPTGRVRRSVEKLFEDDLIIYGLDRLVAIETLKIDPEHRGKRWGLVAANRAIEFFGHGALVVLKPFPLQFGGGKLPDGVAAADRERVMELSRKKLFRYWKQLGAVHIGGGFLAMFGGTPNMEYDDSDEGGDDF